MRQTTDSSGGTDGALHGSLRNSDERYITESRLYFKQMIFKTSDISFSVAAKTSMSHSKIAIFLIGCTVLVGLCVNKSLKSW